MPFSSDGDTIDFIYGVINWKDVGEAAEAPLPPLVPALAAESRTQESSTRCRRRCASPEPRAWPEPLDVECRASRPSDVGRRPAAPNADRSPNATSPHAEPVAALDDDAGLADRLCAARDSAEVCKAADGRSRAALYRALGLAYDFAVAAKRVPDEYAEMLDDAGVKAQARAPMTPIVKLVFGADYDKTRLTEFAAALSYAERREVDFGGFLPFVESQVGGLKGLVAAERDARRPADKADDTRRAGPRSRCATLRRSHLADVPADEEFALVLTRRGADGVHEPVARGRRRSDARTRHPPRRVASFHRDAPPCRGGDGGSIGRAPMTISESG